MGVGPGSSKIYSNKHNEVNYFITWKYMTGRGERTLNSYNRVLREFFHDQFPDLSPSEIETQYVEDRPMALTNRDVSQNSKKKYLEILSSLYGHTLKRPQFEGITSSPAVVATEEIPRVCPDHSDYAAWKNACRLINVIPDSGGKAVTVTLTKTGTRLLEVLSIGEDDADLERRFIRLRECRGGKQTVVPADDEITYAIKCYQFVSADLGSPYLFISSKEGRLSKERIRREVKAAADCAGVTPKKGQRFEREFTPHIFHIVFTTLMRKQGMKPYILKYIREDTKAETVDIYTRADRGEAKEKYLDCIKEIGL